MVQSARALPKSSLWGGLDLITVLLGTNPYSFERLIREVDAIAREYELQFYVQLGNTQLIPQFCTYERFVNRTTLFSKIMESDLVITHGGFGSIHDALECRKPVVAVPRQPHLGESQDVQEELVRELEKDGKVVAVYDIDKLYDKIQYAYSNKLNYNSKNNINEIINNYLQKNNI
jgi:UDP-N-acetylglucosamine transferase subunit ALG13